MQPGTQTHSLIGKWNIPASPCRVGLYHYAWPRRFKLWKPITQIHIQQYDKCSHFKVSTPFAFSVISNWLLFRQDFIFAPHLISIQSARNKHMQCIYTQTYLWLLWLDYSIQSTLNMLFIQWQTWTWTVLITYQISSGALGKAWLHWHLELGTSTDSEWRG